MEGLCKMLKMPQNKMYVISESQWQDAQVGLNISFGSKI